MSRLLWAALLALAVAAGGARGAPLAVALGPQVPEAEAQGGFVGKLAVAPPHAPAGARVAVTGSALPPDTEFDLVWRTVEGRWKVADGAYHGRAYSPVGYRIAAVTTDAAGTFTASFTAPEDFGFEHDLVVEKAGRLFTQAAFTLDMTMRVTPQSGPPGTPITVEVAGIGWRELENSWMLVYDNGFTGWVSAVTTHGTARFAIPATGPAGPHVLRLVHGEFTFPYLNPQQNPVPDRPRFRGLFTLTEGAPVLPPAPERQTQQEVRGLPPPGALRASPAFAGVRAAMTVSGAGFAPGRSYALRWTTVTGNRVVAGGYEESARTIATATAGADGTIEFRFAVPDDLGGPHALEAGGRRGVATIVTTALPLASKKFATGNNFTLHLKGVGWTETANIYHVVYDNAYLGYACGFNSQGDVAVELPASGAPGWHFVDLYPGIYKGEETRPNDFRIPQLTYAADHPGEDLPAFHYAFRVAPAGEGE